MNSSKRRHSDQDDQLTTTKARVGKSEHIPDQDIDSRVALSTTFDKFRLVVKLHSMSKAARNDPSPPLSPVELFSRHESELETGKDASRASELDRSTVSETSRKTLTHDLGTPEKQERLRIDYTTASTNREEGGSRNRPIVTDDPKSQNENASGTHVERVVMDTNNDIEGSGSPQCFQADDDEEQSEGNSFDEDERSENNPHFAFDWLEGIDVKLTSLVNQDGDGNPEIAGFCEAKLIRRNQIRHDFYAQLEQPSRETSWLAFELFDRYGCLRSEFITHPIIKGTGVWGRELDFGDMLLIEEIFVKKDYRRQQLGRKMVEALLQAIELKTKSFIAFTFPSILRLGDILQEYNLLKDDVAINEMEDRESDRAIAFCRSLDFRRVGNSDWFAMTAHHEHSSHKIASTEDIDPLKRGISTLHPLLKPFQHITDPSSKANEQWLGLQPPGDPDFLGTLQNCAQQEGSTATFWMATDKYGNNLLHLASKIMDVSCVRWILKQDFGSKLLNSRNQRGETPKESLIFHLEKSRVQHTINLFTACISDKFRGHNPDGVECLILLQGFPDADLFVKAKGMLALLQLCGGCTCGKCIEGILSPKMSYVLCTQAEMGYDILCEQLYDCSGIEWVEYNNNYLKFLPSKLRDNLATNKSIRQGFVNLWKHIASCLKRGELPKEHNVLEELRIANEWPPDTKNFLQTGGRVGNAYLAVYEIAMLQDDYVGDGMFADLFSEDIAKLPECRNDREFGFVSGMCGYRPISLIHNKDVMGNTLDEYGNVIDSLR